MTAERHTLAVQVMNRPGVLTRVAALFSRRGFNIESLAVGPTERPEISRITLVAIVDEVILEQLNKQLNKLVEVLKVVELDESAVRRRLALIKVRATIDTRQQVLEVVQMFRCNVVDVATDSVIIEATGSREKLEALLDMLEPFGVKEIAQSGQVSLSRGNRSISDKPRSSHRQIV